MSTLNDDVQLATMILEFELQLKHRKQCCDQLRNMMHEMEKCEQCCASCMKKKAPDNKTELFKCGRCQIVYYCDIACQKKHWVEHKEGCNTMRKFRKIPDSGSKDLLSYLSNLDIPDP
jgi:hypothetical protein